MLGTPRTRALAGMGASLGGAALLSLTVTTAALAAPARPAYGPQPAPPPPGSTGFHCVVTSRVEGSAGGTISGVKIQSLHVTIRIPAGDLPPGAEVAVTAPSVASADCAGTPLGNAGFPGRHALGGIGIQVQVGGSDFRGLFPHPIIITVQSAAIGQHSIAAAYNGHRYMRDHHVRVHGHTMTIRLLRDADVAILGRGPVSPAGARTTPRSAAQFLAAALPLSGGLPQGTGVTMP